MRSRAVVTGMLLLSLLAPSRSAGRDESPRQQEFVITAYYSPLSDQCCYVKGSEQADKVLNGQGLVGADGTPVYAGMIAAPKSYGFGTTVELPGIGTFTVHDRGGAIRELQDGTHRLDIWVGWGEEGLARALAFGVERVRGTVYAPGTATPGDSFDPKRLSAPNDKLRPFLVADAGILDVRPKFGDSGLSVQMLQEHLRDAGYFDHAVTGSFRDVTQSALRAFLKDAGIDEPADRLTGRSAAFLLAAVWRSAAKLPFKEIGPESDVEDLAAARRILRFLGHYDGRTDGAYGDALFAGILRFQKSAGLAGGPDSPGAGRIGPKTRAALMKAWNRAMVAQRAERLLAFQTVRERIRERGALPRRFLEAGDEGGDVRALQRLLAERGFFPEQKINGIFGPVTREAVLAFQHDRDLIESDATSGAGTVGPATLRALALEESRELYDLVRAFGWTVL